MQWHRFGNAFTEHLRQEIFDHYFLLANTVFRVPFILCDTYTQVQSKGLQNVNVW